MSTDPAQRLAELARQTERSATDAAEAADKLADENLDTPGGAYIVRWSRHLARQNRELAAQAKTVAERATP